MHKKQVIIIIFMMLLFIGSFDQNMEEKDQITWKLNDDGSYTFINNGGGRGLSLCMA